MLQRPRHLFVASCRISLASSWLHPAARAVEAQSALTVTTLETRIQGDPIGIDVTRPPLQLAAARPPPAPRGSGRTRSSSAGAQATSRRIAATPGTAARVASRQVQQIEYGGRAVAAGPLLLEVGCGMPTASFRAWSSVAFFEMGLLSSADWTAHWIAEPTASGRSPLLAQGVVVTRASAARASMPPRWVSTSCSSTATASARDYFTPGWTA